MSDVLAEGTRAPDFQGRDHDGKPIRLADFAGRVLVLYFYPADMTYGCTKEACSFRDEQDRFHALGAAVVGVSVQDEASHREFRAKENLNFPLIADTDKTITRAYNALSFLGVAKRVTYVIGPDGTILLSLNSMNPKPHSQEALRVVSEYVKSHGQASPPAAPGADPAARPA